MVEGRMHYSRKRRQEDENRKNDLVGRHEGTMGRSTMAEKECKSQVGAVETITGSPVKYEVGCVAFV
jgi:hypothetical protein